MNTAHPNDSWNKGRPYEMYVGRWSRLVANEFLAWLAACCGPGALPRAIFDRCRPAQLIGVDPSEGFLAEARERLSGNATFHVVNSMALPLKDASMDVIVSGLVLNFIPNPAA